jgi:hypothetical protein
MDQTLRCGEGRLTTLSRAPKLPTAPREYSVKNTSSFLVNKLETTFVHTGED